MKIIILIFMAFFLNQYLYAQVNQIDREMAHYDQLILKGSYDSIADMFTTNGALRGENQTPVIGKDSIRKLLRTFQGTNVLKYETNSKGTTFKADSAIQKGSYIQIVKIPNGDTLQLAGQYIATWIKEADGKWLIKTMYTHHYLNLKEEQWIEQLPDNSIAKQYENILLSKGFKSASLALTLLRKDSTKYLNENEFNRIGYNLMSKDKNEEALQFFKLNTKFFPASWNAYDSYGEALLKNGNKIEAIKMYEKSIELNSNNTNAKLVLQKIKIDKSKK